MQLKESRILLTTGIQNPSSSDKYWNPESTVWNPESKTVLDSLTWGEKMTRNVKRLRMLKVKLHTILKIIKANFFKYQETNEFLRFFT